MIINSNIYILVVVIFFSTISLYLVWRSFLQIKKFSDTNLAKKNRNYIFSKPLFIFKYSSLLFAILLISFSFLRPQWGDKQVKSEGEGIDLVFVLDVSKSMKALDMSIKGTNIDRLAAAKAMIADYVTNNAENRYSLVVFAGEAFVSTPLTFDNEAFLTFLDSVDYDSVSKQGTNLEEALKASISRFSGGEKEERGKALILISDGGDEISGNFMDFAKVAKKEGIKIFTIGVGSKKDVPIPDGVDFFGRVNYKTFRGKPVMVKLNEKPLKDIAVASNGKYFSAENIDDLKKVSSDLAGLKTSVMERIEKRQGEDQYQLFLFMAFCFFLLFIFIKPKNLERNNLFIFLKKKLKLLQVLVLLFILSGCSNNKLFFTYYLNNGNEGFSQEYYSEALDSYKKAGGYSSVLKYVADNNSGLSEYRQEKYAEAENFFDGIVKDCENGRRKFCDQIYYNAGNVFYRLGEKTEELAEKKKLWEKAIESYKKTLIINKDDKEATENIDFIKSKLQELDQEEQKQKDERSKNDQGNQDGQKTASSTSQQADSKQGQNGEAKDAKQEQEQGSSPQANGEKQDNKAESAQNQADGKKKDQASASEPGSQNKTGDGQNPSAMENKSLSQDEKTQLDNYMKQMEDRQRNLKGFFQQKPGQSKNNPDDFFSQFDEFFNNGNDQRQLGGISGGDEKDW